MLPEGKRKILKLLKYLNGDHTMTEIHIGSRFSVILDFDFQRVL